MVRLRLNVCTDQPKSAILSSPWKIQKGDKKSYHSYTTKTGQSWIILELSPVHQPKGSLV